MKYHQIIYKSPLISQEVKDGLQQEIAGLQKKNGAPAIIRSSSKKATEEDARAIFGIDFISTTEAERVYGKGKKPKIPFSISTLEKAKILDFHLVSKIKRMSLADMALALKGKKCHDGGLLLWKDQFDSDNGEIKKSAWFVGDSKVTSECVMSVGWSLSMKGALDQTSDKKFIPQLRLNANFLSDKLYAVGMTKLARKAIAEFNEEENRLTDLMESDWKKCTEESMKLLLVRHFMENSVDTLNRLVLEEQIHERKLLTNMYIRNNTSSTVGVVLDSGGFDSVGVRVAGAGMDVRIGNLGLSPSCTE